MLTRADPKIEPEVGGCSVLGGEVSYERGTPVGMWSAGATPRVADQGATPYTLHLLPTPNTLNPTPHALHPTPHTLHPTTYTLHPTP